MEYKFRIANEDEREKFIYSSKICSVYDNISYMDILNGKYALTLGQLMSAFGEPLYLSENFEQQYEYQIVAEDEAEKKYMLTVYSGPSGPSIGEMPRIKTYVKWH